MVVQTQEEFARVKSLVQAGKVRGCWVKNEAAKKSWYVTLWGQWLTTQPSWEKKRNSR